MHCLIALLPLVINTPLSNSGLYYGFYTFSSPSAYGFCPFTVDADDA
ncbi:hypothetical protein SB96558_3838 [Shigella boydii 965-58]|nr:hypothetical protein SB96558_3838 [Shigella boydii 965-58]